MQAATAISASLGLMAAICLTVGSPSPCHGLDGDGEPGRWVQSFDAGYRDDRGAYAGGSEIMHLAAHQGQLYAANGYWVDRHWEIPPDTERQSAQVLRLDSADSRWQVDLDTGQSNGLGLGYMKGNILKSVTFTRDSSGKPLPVPQTLLVMSAGARFERGGAVSAWVRNDDDGTWTHSLVRHGSSLGGVRWVPRDMQVYRDKVTGLEQLFLLLGNPGVITGVYDPATPSSIRWKRDVEFPFLTTGSFRTRPLGIVEANGTLLLSEGSSIYRRNDGHKPVWTEILDLNQDTDTDVGGIRGLTTIDNPNGDGQSILFLWAPGDRSRSQIKRLDPDSSDGYTVHDEASMLDLMSQTLQTRVTYTLGGHSMLYPVQHPDTGETLHLIGFQGRPADRQSLLWKGRLYGGAMYAVRKSDQTYSVLEVNNAYAPGKPFLVSPRTFCVSPFGDDSLYIGGHDSSNAVSDDMAWIFRAPIRVAVGATQGLDSVTPAIESPVEPRLTAGPVYELRIYAAAEGRFPHLLKRFREHTHRLFTKHRMTPVGYWVPVDGPQRLRRTLIYILEHDSRYAAWKNWIRFSNDNEWKSVLENPSFQRLLTGPP
ncbi:MAG: NIPSNAP family protein, partial [Planctomycetaceae bacterium]